MADEWNDGWRQGHSDALANLKRAEKQTLADKARIAELEAVLAVVCKEVHEGELNECRLEARLAEAERDRDRWRDRALSFYKPSEVLAVTDGTPGRVVPIAGTDLYLALPAASAAPQESDSHG